MTDDLLRALGREQRDRLDESRTTPEPDELAWSFDDGERAALLDAVFERVDASAGSQPTEQARAEDPPNLVRLPARRRWLLVGTVVAAAAAAALIWSVIPSGGRDRELVASVPPYAFTRLDGGAVATRSDHDPTTAAVPELELHPSSSIDWVLTPAEPTRDPIGVSLLAESSTDRTFVPTLDVEVSERGAVRLRGRLDRWITLTPGDWSLRLFIATPDELPSEADAMSDRAGAWRSLDVRVTIVVGE